MKLWMKIAGVVMIIYSIVGGFMISVPAQPILHETSRNLFFHVPMWFTMMLLMTISFVYSLLYLNKENELHDTKAAEANKVALVFAIAGLLTGSLWARFTWGAWWTNDVKLNASAATFLIYLIYLLLRQSIPNDKLKARVSAVFNIFAYVMMVVLIMILPRVLASLHPGNGGNPAFSKMDSTGSMKMVLYPAFIGWMLVGYWLYDQRVALRNIEIKKEETE